MTVSALLQLSLVSSREWSSLFGRVDRLKEKAVRSMSFSAGEIHNNARKAYRRAQSMPQAALLTREWLQSQCSMSETDTMAFEKKRN